MTLYIGYLQGSGYYLSTQEGTYSQYLNNIGLHDRKPHYHITPDMARLEGVARGYDVVDGCTKHLWPGQVKKLKPRQVRRIPSMSTILL